MGYWICYTLNIVSDSALVGMSFRDTELCDFVIIDTVFLKCRSSGVKDIVASTSLYCQPKCSLPLTYELLDVLLDSAHAKNDCIFIAYLAKISWRVISQLKSMNCRCHKIALGRNRNSLPVVPHYITF